ncbi:MAG: TonB-dependent receptor [Candidatus Zixiibacteriota bacterium]
MRLVWAQSLARLLGRFLRSCPRSSFRRTTRQPLALIISIILFLAVIPSRARCQDFVAISGAITDSLLNEPIAGVIITALPDGRSALSNTDGSFLIARLTPGLVTLQIESAFHMPVTIGPLQLREGDTRNLAILLQPLTLTTGAAEVTATRDAAVGVTSYLLSESNRAASTYVGDFLSRSGFYLESDGRTKYASLRGFSPQAILVLVDGVPINPDGSPADLSAIATESVERVEVYTTGAASRFGANALGGAINIISRKTPGRVPSANASLATGSYDLRRGAANLTAPDLRGVDIVANYDYQQQTNDFSYDHPYNGEQTRINNSSRNYGAYVSLRSVYWRNLSLLARLSNSHSELPGAIFQETGSAMAKRRNDSYSLSYSTARLNLLATFRELRQSFADHSSFIAYDKDYLQTARLLHAEYRTTPLKNFIASVGSDLSSESFFNDDNIAPSRSLPIVSRKTIAAYTGAIFDQAIGKTTATLDARYRLDRISGKNHGSPFAGASFKVNLPITVGAEASYSESFRLPPIDATFWRGDVFSEANPDLRPERAVTREAGLNFKYDRVIVVAASHTWFKSAIDDLIIWRRQFDGKYKPVNIDRSRYVGAESSITLAPRNRRFEISYHRTSLDAVNLSTTSGYYGQTVPFKPDLVERLALDLDFGLFGIQYQYSYTGERQIREANTKQLPGFALHDLAFDIPVKLWSRRHTLRAAVANFTNTRYELLERMPMPPRSYSLTLNVQI